MLAPDLEPMAQRYVTVHLSESVFKALSGLFEDWILGFARLWLAAYPKQLDAAHNEVTDRSSAQRRSEIQVPLSEILAAADKTAILVDVIERVVHDLAYRRPVQWFRFIENRVNLGCPSEVQRSALCEMKAAREVLEHNRGIVVQDYLDKAGEVARFVLGDTIQIDEPYLLNCFGLMRDVVNAMATAAIRKILQFVCFVKSADLFCMRRAFWRVEGPFDRKVAVSTVVPRARLSAWPERLRPPRRSHNSFLRRLV